MGPREKDAGRITKQIAGTEAILPSVTFSAHNSTYPDPHLPCLLSSDRIPVGCASRVY